MWRGTQEAEGTGFEYQQTGNSRAGVQIPLSPPPKTLKFQRFQRFSFSKKWQVCGSFSKIASGLQSERLKKLNDIAIHQMTVLEGDRDYEVLK